MAKPEKTLVDIAILALRTLKANAKSTRHGELWNDAIRRIIDTETSVGHDEEVEAARLPIPRAPTVQ